MRTHRAMMILGAGVLLGLTLSAVSAGLIDLTSPGEGSLAGPLLKPTTLPFLDADQLLTKGDTADVVAIDQLFAAYVFYHDSMDGERLASLFLPDGIFEDVYNDYGTLEPTYGVGGLGCVLTGREQIAKFISDESAGNPNFPSPFPGHGHHNVSSKLIRVDGNHATLTATWHYVSVNDLTNVYTIPVGGRAVRGNQA